MTAGNRPLIEQLIEALRCLPGVGPKSAQRMAYSLLQRDRQAGRHLAHTLLKALDSVRHCQRCRNLTELDVCRLCQNQQRDRGLLCIVESPMDVQAIEQAATYRGLYFVLMGRLSPLDGVGPDELGFTLLQERLAEGTVKEIIVATNATVEGEATAHYIADMAHRHRIKCSRIAQGVPVGGELEYVDGGTLVHALAGRREI